MEHKDSQLVLGSPFPPPTQFLSGINVLRNKYSIVALLTRRVTETLTLVQPADQTPAKLIGNVHRRLCPILAEFGLVPSVDPNQTINLFTVEGLHSQTELEGVTDFAKVHYAKSTAEAKTLFLSTLFLSVQGSLPAENLVIVHDLAQQPELVLDCMQDYRTIKVCVVSPTGPGPSSHYPHVYWHELFDGHSTLRDRMRGLNIMSQLLPLALSLTSNPSAMGFMQAHAQTHHGMAPFGFPVHAPSHSQPSHSQPTLGHGAPLLATPLPYAQLPAAPTEPSKPSLSVVARAAPFQPPAPAPAPAPQAMTSRPFPPPSEAFSVGTSGAASEDEDASRRVSSRSSAEASVSSPSPADIISVPSTSSTTSANSPSTARPTEEDGWAVVGHMPRGDWASRFKSSVSVASFEDRAGSTPPPPPPPPPPKESPSPCSSSQGDLSAASSIKSMDLKKARAPSDASRVLFLKGLPTSGMNDEICRRLRTLVQRIASQHGRADAHDVGIELWPIPHPSSDTPRCATISFPTPEACRFYMTQTFEYGPGRTLEISAYQPWKRLVFTEEDRNTRTVTVDVATRVKKMVDDRDVDVPVIAQLRAHQRNLYRKAKFGCNISLDTKSWTATGPSAVVDSFVEYACALVRENTVNEWTRAIQIEELANMRVEAIAKKFNSIGFWLRERLFDALRDTGVHMFISTHFELNYETSGISLHATVNYSRDAAEHRGGEGALRELLNAVVSNFRSDLTVQVLRPVPQTCLNYCLACSENNGKTRFYLDTDRQRLTAFSLTSNDFYNFAEDIKSHPDMSNVVQCA